MEEGSTLPNASDDEFQEVHSKKSKKPKQTANVNKPKEKLRRNEQKGNSNDKVKKSEAKSSSASSASSSSLGSIQPPRVPEQAGASAAAPGANKTWNLLLLSKTLSTVSNRVEGDTSKDTEKIQGLVYPRPIRLSRNSCFGNCIFQLLVGIPTFVRNLADLDEEQLLQNGLLNCYHFKQFANNYAESDYSDILDGSTVAPIVESFRHLMGSVTDTQEDASEFLTYFVDRLNDEAIRYSQQAAAHAASLPLCPNKSAVSSSSSSSLSSRTVQKASVSADDEWTVVGVGKASSINWNSAAASAAPTNAAASSVASAPASGTSASSTAATKIRKARVDEASKAGSLRALSASFVSKLFFGVLRSDVLYQQKKESSGTFQSFISLSVDIPARQHSSASVPSLQSCINAYFQVEELANGSRVRNTAVSATKKVLLLQAIPPYLIIHLKRFAFAARVGEARKVHAPVEYPNLLQIDRSWAAADLQAQLGPGMTKETEVAVVDGDEVRASETVLELDCVVLHHGDSLDRGHYTCYRRFPACGKQQWCHINDAQLTPIDDREVLSATSTAYILLYRLREKK